MPRWRVGFRAFFFAFLPDLSNRRMLMSGSAIKKMIFICFWEFYILTL